MFQHSLKALGLSLLLSLADVHAAPTDGVIQRRNTLGTALTDFIGCTTEGDGNQKLFLRLAYFEAHKIVNVDGVKNNIAWEDIAANDFFGPSQYNKDQQSQIQAVFANVETMEPGYFFKPFGHSLQAVDHYKDSDKPDIKWNVDNYQNRGLIFLHELFHLDLAANSEKNTPNPKIFDIKVSYESETGVIGLPKKAYGARLSKLLARFQPKDPKEGKPPPRQTGYWVQRNVDNFSRFAMAKYLEAKGQLGAYPYFPFVYDKLQYPLEPGDRQGKTLIGFEAADGSDAILDLDTSDMEEDLVGEASFDETHTTDEVFEVGEPYSLDDYPESYREAYAGWLKELEGNTDGICKLEVHQIWTCEDVASNLYAELKITDPSGNTLYQTGKSAHTPGVPINDAFPLKLKEDGMDETLTVVGEHTDDYIQFYYGSTAWRSTDTEGDASCKLVGDNWAVSGPGGDCPNAMAVSRNFECQYPCGSSGV